MRQIKFPIKQVIGQSSFMRIGKYLFVAIAFPPYMIIVEIPKWIFAQAIPYLFSQVINVTMKVQKKIEPFWGSVRKYSRRALETVKQSLRILIDPVVRVISSIGQGIQKYRVKLQEMVSRVVKNSISSIPNPFIAARKGVEKIVKMGVDRISTIREKGSKAIAKIGEVLQTPVQWVKEIPSQIVILAYYPYTILQQKTAGIRKKLRESKETTDRVMKKIADKLNKGRAILREGLVPYVNFYKQKWLPLWQRIKQWLKKRGNQAREFFQRNQQRARLFFEEKQEKIKKLSDQPIRFLWLMRFDGKWRIWLTKFFFHPSVHLACKKGVQFYCAFMLGLLRFFPNMILTIEKGLSFTAKTALSIYRLYEKNKKRVIHWLHIGVQQGARFSWISCYYVLLGAVMTGILCQWGGRGCASLLLTTKKSLFSFIKKK